VERRWKKSKYSVNNEDLSKNNDEPTKNNVKIKQLVTQKRGKKDDTLKNSESSADAENSTQPQLQPTAHKTETKQHQLKGNFQNYC
jgi:hypothetical protein